MKISLSKRKLTEEEIDLLAEEVKNFPNPMFGRREKWQNFDPVYILYSNNSLVGICGASRLKQWIKLGPLVIFRKYQGQGYGKTLIKNIIKDYPNHNLYIGSRNPKVHKIASDIGFEKISQMSLLPFEIKLYLITNIIDSLSFYYIKELFQKKPNQEGKYISFIKKKK